MRVTRGLLASLGASGCIAAAGACALLAVSTAIGFRGWPGLSGGSVAGETISARAAAPRPAPHERLGGGGVVRAAHAARHILAATEAGPRDLPSGPASAPSRRAQAPATARPAPAAAAAPSAPAAAAP